MFPAYVDYTSQETLETIKQHGFTKFAAMNSRVQGIDLPEVTEKTAGEVVNACLTTHLLTKKYLDSSVDNLKKILR